MARLFSAYLRGVQPLIDPINAMITAFGGRPGDLSVFQSTLGRVAIRQIETIYVADLVSQWCGELLGIIKDGGLDDYYTKPAHYTGAGTGFWEAPRGALYHSEKVTDGRIDGYQIVIPTTWNLAPRDATGTHGPTEQALIGAPVTDLEMPINVLRTAHSFDPCTACSVHVSEPASGKHFEVVTSPWGVR